MSRVVLAMSGGVDSSASALLLREAGHEVVGLFMRSGETDAVEHCDPRLPIVGPSPSKQGCCSASDAADARRVADQLDIPFHSLDFSDSFARIKDYFVAEYLAGRTPNPCVQCNNWLKFGRLWDFAVSVGADKIATGHYARIAPADDGATGLFAARDPAKDQSYVLFGLRPELLDRILFPVGELPKSRIRALAAQAGLRVAHKPDSQEICFIPDHDYAGFVARHSGAPDTAGEVVDSRGRVLGRHEGYERFTIGQRKGLGIAFGEPRYVTEIDAASKRVVVGPRDELACRGLVAGQANWLVRNPPASFRAEVKIRYLHRPTPATIRADGPETFHVEFDEPQFGVAPGQACVVYAGDRVLGGGWIRTAARTGRENAS